MTQRWKSRKVYTQDDYEKTIEAAKKRIADAKKVDAEIIDVKD